MRPSRRKAACSRLSPGEGHGLPAASRARSESPARAAADDRVGTTGEGPAGRVDHARIAIAERVSRIQTPSSLGERGPSAARPRGDLPLVGESGRLTRRPRAIGEPTVPVGPPRAIEPEVPPERRSLRRWMRYQGRRFRLGQRTGLTGSARSRRPRVGRGAAPTPLGRGAALVTPVGHRGAPPPRRPRCPYAPSAAATLSGFRRPAGSSARFSARMTSIAGPASSASRRRLPSPTPCSPVQVPPARSARSTSRS
jgi:hypothetical protein